MILCYIQTFGDLSRVMREEIDETARKLFVMPSG